MRCYHCSNELKWEGEYEDVVDSGDVSLVYIITTMSCERCPAKYTITYEMPPEYNLGDDAAFDDDGNEETTWDQELADAQEEHKEKSRYMYK